MTRTSPGCGSRFQTTVSPGIPIPGPQGERGLRGPQGPQGVTGSPGAGLVVRGTVPTAPGTLPTSGNRPGDGWIALDTGHIWCWTGSAWIDGGPFGGPQGPPGPPGALASMEAHDFTGLRFTGTAYTNMMTTAILITVQFSQDPATTFSISVGGVVIYETVNTGSAAAFQNFMFPVPAGATYEADYDLPATQAERWVEWY